MLGRELYVVLSLLEEWDRFVLEPDVRKGWLN
jgi:hypothetical protein